VGSGPEGPPISLVCLVFSDGFVFWGFSGLFTSFLLILVISE
jgi:hypothetical protein